MLAMPCDSVRNLGVRADNGADGWGCWLGHRRSCRWCGAGAWTRSLKAHWPASQGSSELLPGRGTIITGRQIRSLLESIQSRWGFVSEVRHQPLAYPRLSTTLAL
jgi:hypothetical protein